jgi:glyoxylase-like metal-dependent hydrolase (beta-lactamase superfamily II)
MHRRHFLRHALGGAALLVEAAQEAAWARAAVAVQGPGPELFDIEQVVPGVWAAIARASYAINSNAAIFEAGDGLLVVDTHSKPSAARALAGQLAKVSDKPVRYVVNSHFHWDHAQGNSAHTAAPPAAGFPRTEIISSTATRDWLAREGAPRLKTSLAQLPKQLEEVRGRIAKEKDTAERGRLKQYLAQGEAYLRELQTTRIELPTLVFDRQLVIHKGGREIQLFFLGRGHTAGDVVVWLPQERVVATGDLAHGLLPYIGDGYPLEWPATLDKLMTFDIARVLPGHGGVQQGTATMRRFRNYIEELTTEVRRRAAAGQPLEAIKKEIGPATLRSLQEPGYLDALAAAYRSLSVTTPRPMNTALADFVSVNVEEIHRRLQA